MLIIDYSQTCISNVLVHKEASYYLSEDLIRHYFLNTIRSYIKKYSAKYGNEIILAVDSANSWRKSEFKYYKSHRQDVRDKNQQEETVDWTKLYKIMAEVEEEIRENFPYKVIRVERAEADDIIAILAKEGSKKGEKVLILSADGDFCQLHDSYIDQYDIIRKKFLKVDDVDQFLALKIINGDRGDGIPNVFSPENAYYDKIRQTPATKKKVDDIILDVKMHDFDGLMGDVNNIQLCERLHQNRKMIDFKEIPENIVDSVISEYNKYEGKEKDRSKIHPYLVKNRLVNLLDKVKEF